MECSVGTGEPTSPDDEAEHGFILVVVLWLLVFLAFAAIVFSYALRSHVRSAAVIAPRAQAEGLADAGVHLAIADLVQANRDRRHKRRFAIDGTGLGCSAPDGGRVVVVVRDEAGRIDLNAATEPLLGALIAGAGVAPERARTLAAAILDFRDGDDTRRPDGAETADYLAAGRTAGPKNAAFDSVLELDLVLGFDAETLARIRPWLTVGSGHQGVDPAQAAPQLVAMLTAGHDRLSGKTTIVRAADGDRPVLPVALAGNSSQRVYRIVARGIAASGVPFVRDAVVQIAPTRTTPYAIRAWQQTGIEAFDASRIEDAGKC